MNRTNESFKDFVLDQLHQLEGVEARRMFGGFGLYRDEIFFGIVHGGRLYFKTDDSTVSSYRRRKMKPFRPNAGPTLKNYYRVPVEILEDGDALCEWARHAIGCWMRGGSHPRINSGAGSDPLLHRGRKERRK